MSFSHGAGSSSLCSPVVLLSNACLLFLPETLSQRGLCQEPFTLPCPIFVFLDVCWLWLFLEFCEGDTVGTVDLVLENEGAQGGWEDYMFLLLVHDEL